MRVSDPRRADAGPLRTLIGASATTKCVAWRSENESVLAAGARNGRVLVWDLRSEKEDPVLSFTLDEAEKGALRTKRKKAKLGAAPSRSITSVLFADVDSYGLIGTSSHDG